MSTQGHHLDRLTAVDPSFLPKETASSHMHVGAILIFEGPPPRYVDLVEHVRGRLSQVPRFRQRLVVPPRGAGGPRGGRARGGLPPASCPAPSRSGRCGWRRGWSATASRS